MSEPHDPDDHQVLIDILESAPDGITHTYWSTHCRHAALLDGSEAERLHGMCSATEITGKATTLRGVRGKRVTLERPASIERKPAQCKTCAAPCICPCHKSSTGGAAA